MNEAVKLALDQDQLIDISTRGRKTGQARQIEIRLHNLNGHLYLSGSPTRPRSWYANLVADPQFTIHLKQSAQADLVARATPIRERTRRREIMAAIHQKTGSYSDLDAWVERSPLVSIELLSG